MRGPYNLFVLSVLSVQYLINWTPFVYKLYSSTYVKLQNTKQTIPNGPNSRLYSVCSTLVFIHFAKWYGRQSNGIMEGHMKLRSQSIKTQGHLKIWRFFLYICLFQYLSSYLYPLLNVLNNMQISINKEGKFNNHPILYI